MVADDPVPGARDVGRQLRVPERVVDVDHDADPGVADALGDVERLAQRRDGAALADHHRVQRLDAEPNAPLGRVRQDRRDAVLDQRARRPRSRAGGPHTSTSASVPSVAASSIARRLSSSRFWRSSCVADGKYPPRHKLETLSPLLLRRSVCRLGQPDFGDLVPPRRDPAHARSGAALDKKSRACPSSASWPGFQAQPRSAQPRPARLSAH